MNSKEDNMRSDKGNLLVFVCFALILVIGAADIVRCIMLGKLLPVITICVIEILIALTGYIGIKTRFPLLFLLPGIGTIILCVFMNHMETTTFYSSFFIQAGLSLICVLAGLYRLLRKDFSFHKFPLLPVLAIALVLAMLFSIWGIGFLRARTASSVKREIWGVPKKYDSAASSQPGRVEKLTYHTKAYATDSRDVEKNAYVYLPYGYDEDQKYNILYLMHGTGDNEAYWLETHSYNKVMLDQMIEQKIIEPLIVVTPTFYVEEDCMDGLDALTYSFREELRNDLMPLVEGTYSTYAASCDDPGFRESRDHRAFAGLSRGAVTTNHSVFCGSLDYFSWFGTFSGSRTSGDYFKEHLQSEEFKDYSIHYLYVSSGNFDFALPGQIEDYKALLEVESRLKAGENTNFDIFPMRYHSIGNWHLALYNFLLKIF